MNTDRKWVWEKKQNTFYFQKVPDKKVVNEPFVITFFYKHQHCGI